MKEHVSMTKDEVRELEKLVKEKPRHFSQIINRDAERKNKIIEATHYIKNASIGERVYNILSQESAFCKYGKKKKFNSIKEGYRNCGKASTCMCTRESVSNNVSKAKSEYTQEQKQTIHSKRVKTNYKKYGVPNTGQTKKAKDNHKEFYDIEDNVKLVVGKNKKTKKERYNNEKYNNIEKIKETWDSKNKSGYWNNVYPDKNLEELHDEEKLLELYKVKDVVDISEELNVHPQTVYRYLRKNGIKEPYKSHGEADVLRYINNELGINNIIENSRKILDSGKEIDIFLPDYGIAIEYNGLYWHHDQVANIDKNYHMNKYLDCYNKGIMLLTIYSDVWKNKKSVVKNIIKNKLKKSKKTCYARQCFVKEINTKQAKDFLNKHHISGYSRSLVKYGLFYKNELVACMTFSNKRLSVGVQNKSKKYYEIVRFATKGSIPGAAGKLLSRFEKDYNPEIVVSYSDNEWGHGEVYKKIGFELDKEVGPGYWYIPPRCEERVHRFNYAKHLLVKKGFDKTKTESQITKEDIGLMRLWDCGKKKWIKYYETTSY